MKIKYPKTRRRSYTAKCPYCDGIYYSMGMGTHIREAHKMIYKTLAKTTASPLLKPVATPTAKPVAIPTQAIKTIIAEVAESIGKDLTECKRPDGTHLYTDQDLWILLSRINKVVFQEDSGSVLSKWSTDNICNDLISDFEQRFDCKFDDVKKANKEIKPGKTDKENRDIILRYSHLKYSRSGGFLKENWTKDN